MFTTTRKDLRAERAAAREKPDIIIDVDKEVFLPCYRHLINGPDDIEFYYGGRDSGKSQHVAQVLILMCLDLPYFRCMLIRKTFNSVKDSQWQTIKDTVERWGMAHLFTFKVSPLSIECINGNKFLARGCDDPQTIKSTKDPSVAWIEEGNQLELDDYIVIATTLRAPKGTHVKQFITFNPECETPDYKEFWIYKNFFEGKEDGGTYVWTLQLPDGTQAKFTYRITHTTYHDNPYVTPVRKVFLEKLNDLDPYYYQIFVKGKWGNRKAGDPFAFAFSAAKHVAPTAPSRGGELYLSFDFNVNPITCGVYQHNSKVIFCIEAINLASSDIYKLCDYVRSHYPGYVYIVTGDATGSNTTAMVQDGINYYTIIKTKLNLSSTQLRVPTVNPPIADNRVLVNVALQTMEVYMDPQKCKGLIFDCQHVEVDDMGKIEKGDRKNPKKRADHMDHFRYYLNTFHKTLLKQ